MSIFHNIDENEIGEDFDLFIDVIKKFYLKYDILISNFDYVKFDRDNITSFCLDSKQIYIIFRNYLKQELDDIKNEEGEHIDINKEIIYILENLTILIENIPDENYIKEKSETEIISKLNCEEIIKSSKILKDYFNKMENGMKELNNSLVNLNNTLKDGTKNLELTLKLNEITIEFNDIIKEMNLSGSCYG